MIPRFSLYLFLTLAGASAAQAAAPLADAPKAAAEISGGNEDDAYDPKKPVPPSSPAFRGTTAEQFSRVPGPAKANGAGVFGAYNRGCIAGAVSLPSQSPLWQIMRPSRNRAFGHPETIRTLTEIAELAQKSGWSGLLIGDLAQARGGPMPFGHASHQIGLDADIWLTPMPAPRLSQDGLEMFEPPSMVDMTINAVDPSLFQEKQMALVRIAATHPNVARVFVNARIKKALCTRVPANEHAWLNTVRPAPGHDAHLHIRLHCPEGETFCKGQDAPPEGDGCGAELQSWLSPPRLPKNPKPPKPPSGNRLSLSALPAQCRSLLAQP
jgi:penicillin-insensitive murein endopeptidase